MTYEQQFLEALKSIFMGAEVDGEKFFFDVSDTELKRASEKRELRDYPEYKRGITLMFGKQELTVFIYRSDNLSDEQKERIADFKNCDNNGNWYVLLDAGDEMGRVSQPPFMNQPPISHARV